MASIGDLIRIRVPRKLVIENHSDYAAELHQTGSYYLWSWEKAHEIGQLSLSRKLRYRILSDDMLSEVMKSIAIGGIEFQRSLTGNMRPPARGETASRPAHPGRWADVTGITADSYQAVVDEKTIINPSPYSRRKP